MADAKRLSHVEDKPEPRRIQTAAEAERRFGRTFGWGLPLVTLASAIAVGFIASFGSGILVAASGALLGAIALLWTSLRTLSGDAALPSGLEELSTQRDVDGLAEEKRRALRALKDLEEERALGRIDDADYAEVENRYREEAKQVMRQIDERAAPARAEAEKVAPAYIDRHWKAGRARPTPEEGRVTEAESPPVAAEARRVVCKNCRASNESDATFCKGCGTGIKDSAVDIDASA